MNLGITAFRKLSCSQLPLLLMKCVRSGHNCWNTVSVMGTQIALFTHLSCLTPWLFNVMIPYEESIHSIFRTQYRVGDFFMKEVVFPDFHRKKETDFAAKYLFTQISREAKLQKIYCASLFLIHMDDFSFLTIDFPCTLKLFTAVSASRHFWLFFTLKRKIQSYPPPAQQLWAQQCPILWMTPGSATVRVTT